MKVECALLYTLMLFSQAKVCGFSAHPSSLYPGLPHRNGKLVMHESVGKQVELEQFLNQAS